MSAFQRLLEAIQVPGYDPTLARKSNSDIQPLPASRRTYGPWHFITLWVITGSFNVGGWTTGSSIIALGLNVWQCMLTVIIGNILVGIFCVLSGHPGAKWHIGFPVIQRAAWGVRGFTFVVVQRVFLACIWFSTQVYWGGQCLRVVLTAIAPSYRYLNQPLANGTMTTGDFLAFVLFTFLYLPLIWIRPERYRPFFLISCACIIPTVFILLIWFVVTAGGGGQLLTDVSSLTGIPQATGSRLGWMLLLGICTNISSISVHIYVQSDYTRYARKPTDQVAAQLFMVPMGTIVVALIGVICTSCAATIFPETNGTLLWQPYVLLDTLQLHYQDSSGSRAAAAFAGIAFLVAQFGMVVANNGLSAGMDLSALLPRFFTIRRGMLLMSCLAFVLQPWQLLNGASKFLSVLGGYGVFLGPMTGIMFSDYFLVRRTLFKIGDMYLSSPESIYWYNGGVNWRPFVAWVMGVWITLPGFARNVQGGDPLPGWSNLYYMSWPVGMLVSLMTYYALARIWPVPGLGLQDEPGTMEYEHHGGAGIVEFVSVLHGMTAGERDHKASNDVQTKSAPCSDV